MSYHLGDVRSFHLDQRFEAVIVADSIDYMLTEEDLRAAFQTTYHHLIPGGVFIAYAEQPWSASQVTRLTARCTFLATCM